MKYLRLISLCLGVLASLPGHTKQLTVSDIKHLQAQTQSGSFAGRAQWIALAYYLQGVIEGAAGYHESLEKNKKLPLFCPPKGKGYSLEELLQILQQSSQSDQNRPASLVILEAYKRQYPCK